MKNKYLQNCLLFLLALIFSAGLMFAFTAIPPWLDSLIQNNSSIPGGDPAYQTIKYDLFIQGYGIKLIGMICLALVLLFIIIGFSTRKTGWAWAGAIILFLPVFGTFAASMFYLAGLGLFNTLLYPFMDISLQVMNLGHVVMIPYWILMWFFDLFNWYAHDFLMYFFMAAGALIFVHSVFTWFQTRFEKRKVAKSWLYKISRHPQYLGWIIWSYGLMLYGPTLSNMKKSWGWNGSLAWLLSTMVIIGICMLEEIRMRNQAGEDYDDYRNKTPFLFPIPNILKVIVKAPMRLILRKDRPERNSEVGWSIGVYTLIFIAISLFWIDFTQADTQAAPDQKRIYSQSSIDSLLVEIHKDQNRRYRYKPIKELASYGKPTVNYLRELIRDTDPVVREYSIQAAAEYNYRETIPDIIGALCDSSGRVSRTAMYSLGNMNAIEAEDTLIYYLNNPKGSLSEANILMVLSKLGSEKILPRLYENLNDSLWQKRSSALGHIHSIDPESSWKFIYAALEDTSTLVRRDAVALIMENLPDDAIPHLEKVIDDEQWEVRFYARQAIRLIKKK